MGFLQFQRILWARRNIILIATIGAFLAAMLVVWRLPHLYEAKTRLVLDLVKPDPVTGEIMSSGYAKAYADTQTELITDYRVAGKVVDLFGWTKSPELAEKYAQRRTGEKMDFHRWLAQIVIDNTSATLVEGSNILEISYTAPTPDVARQIADTIRQAYVDQTIAFRREGATRNARWLRIQAEKVKQQLAVAEKRKTDFERENHIVLQDDNSDTEMEKLRAIASTAPLQSGPAAQIASGGPATAQLGQVDAQIASLTQTLGPNHPDLAALRKQRDAIAAEAAREKAQSAPVAATGPSLGNMLSAQTQKVLAQRGEVATAQRLATDVTVLRDQYNKTVARGAEQEQEAESTEAGLTLLGNAVAPERAVFPKVPLILGGALGFGFVLGLLAAFTVELLGRRVRGIEDLYIEGVPTIGVMTRSRPQERTGLLAWLPFIGRRAPTGTF